MRTKLKKAIQLITIIVIGILMVATVVAFARRTSEKVMAAGPIPPAEGGYPKLSLSNKVVKPTLAASGGAELEYNIEILNTGAYTANAVSLVDPIPHNTTLTGEVKSSDLPLPELKDGKILWNGVVGFDSSVAITFSVKVDSDYTGIVSNTAVIDDPAIASPVTVTAEARITDEPDFEISKTASPALPGKNKPLTYELVVTNMGQDAKDTPALVTDFIPDNTTFLSAGKDGSYNSTDKVVTWNRNVTLGFGETSTFTYSVTVGDVVSGTVINNDQYSVARAEDIYQGEPYTTTVVDPILILSKSVYPDPPGANSEMTYTLTVLNLGSVATDLVISDTVPADVEYVRGGDRFKDGVVGWDLASLGTRESAQFTFTVSIGDIADILVLNGDYQVCSAEIPCVPGLPIESLIVGPTFEATATLDPIAKKPGGGTGPVTPTLTVRNLGPGNALDATALINFGNISVSMKDMRVYPKGAGTLGEGQPCFVGNKCTNFTWVGPIAVGEVITFTTNGGQSTVGGDQGTHYTATVVITDDLSGFVTEPITATAIGEMTHYANLVPTKTAPPQIGPGQTMTYTIQVFDSGLSTELSPGGDPPVLTETVPASMTLVSISDGGTSDEVNGREVITWKLPPMGPGDYLFRSFQVTTDPRLISGTLIINDDYRTTWYVERIAGYLSNLGEPVTTTIHEVGLIDSYKTVTPEWASPGKGTVLTYTVHVVNSGPYDLDGVKVTDIFPWEHTTYQRDAVATEGTLDSDIVSLVWTGDVAKYSEDLITFTVKVDNFFEGVITNTATISHESLLQDKVVTAVAYITDKPVLRISKTATPDPVMVNGTLQYKVKVTNLGQMATLLEVSDAIPANTSYLIGSAGSGGIFNEADGVIRWNLPVLQPSESLILTYQVKVLGGRVISNDTYGVTCHEGVFAFGEPVVTRVLFGTRGIYLPVTLK